LKSSSVAVCEGDAVVAAGVELVPELQAVANRTTIRTRACLTTPLPVSLPEHADEHRPERPVLLAVDQELGEGAALRVAPELADPVGPLEVGEHQDVEQLGAGSRPEGIEALTEAAFEFIWPHRPSLRRRIDGRVTGVHAFSDRLDWTYDPVISCGPAT
jgi:hypothetical protein